MTVYVIYLAMLILVGWYLQGDTVTPHTRTVCLGVTAAVLVAIMTLRYGMGYDYFSYQDIFTAVAATPMNEVIAAHNTEMGFYIFTKLVSMVTAEYHVFLLVCNLLMVGCVFWVFYRYSVSWWMSSLLYVTLQFMPHSMNLLRQSLAASILFVGWGFLKKGKLIPYMLVVLLASTFHISALIMIPAYFLLRLPYNRKVLAIYGGAILVAYAAFNPLLNFAVTYIFPQYAQYIDSSIYAAGNSFTFVYLPLACFVGAVMGARALLEKDKSNSILIYAMLFTAAFYLFMTRMYIVERFSIYFFMFAMLLLPELVEVLTPAPLPEKATPKMKIERKKQLQNKQVVMILVVFGTIGYLLFAAATGFHKAYPYVSVFDKQNAVSNNEYFAAHTKR